MGTKEEIAETIVNKAGLTPVDYGLVYAVASEIERLEQQIEELKDRWDDHLIQEANKGL